MFRSPGEGSQDRLGRERPSLEIVIADVASTLVEAINISSPASGSLHRALKISLAHLVAEIKSIAIIQALASRTSLQKSLQQVAHSLDKLLSRDYVKAQYKIIQTEEQSLRARRFGFLSYFIGGNEEHSTLEALEEWTQHPHPSLGIFREVALRSNVQELNIDKLLIKDEPLFEKVIALVKKWNYLVDQVYEGSHLDDDSELLENDRPDPPAIEEIFLRGDSIRYSSQSLYRILHHNWPCHSENHDHEGRLGLSLEAKFCLDPNWSSGEQINDSFFMLLTGPEILQECRVSLNGCGIEDDAPACLITHDDQSQNVCLYLTLGENNQLWDKQRSAQPLELIMAGERYVEMSLSELLMIVKPTYAAKRVIGVTLARSILHLFEGPWLSSCTSIDDVYVYCKVQNDRPFPLFDKVFIATKFGVCKDQRHQKSGTYRIHPFPTILALGVILMEIEQGEDVSEIKTEPSFASKMLNPYYAAQHLLKEFRKRFNLDSGLLLAVKFCIERESFAQLKTLDSEALLSDQEFIDTYYNRIVRPLEEDLVKGAHWTWDQVNQLKSPSSDDAGVCKVFTKGPMQGAHNNFFGLPGHGAWQKTQNEYTSSTNGPKKHERIFSSVRQPRLFQADRQSYFSGKASTQSEKEAQVSDHDIANMQKRGNSNLAQPNLTQPKSLRPRNRDDFNVAIICALQLEANAVQAIFEDHWDDDGVYQYGKQPKDPNSYSAGSIGGHNVVLAHQPRMGRATAANVASVCSMSFTNLKLVLVVGVCGGVPVSGNKREILLGDVVISKGIVPYGFGRQYPGQFRRKTTINDQPGRPDMEISSLIARLETTINRTKLQEKISSYLFESNTQSPGNRTVCYPGQTEDKLFSPEYIHKHHDASTSCDTCINGICDTAMESSCRDLKCDQRELVARTRLNQENKPSVHFGLIASGDTVLKSATDRDRIANEAKVIAFEMEGSGVWDTAPCVIIKGVCDYADSHKNKLWQDYAAMTAAASAKAFLRHWSVNTRLTR